MSSISSINCGKLVLGGNRQTGNIDIVSRDTNSKIFINGIEPGGGGGGGSVPISGTGDITITGNVTANGKHIQNGSALINGKITSTSSVSGGYKGPINVQGWKGFDIEHPNKEGHRLRHICVEGPEAAVYIRGKCKDTNIINLPEYWNGLVDLDELSVNLTPFGSPQNLYVEDVKWGRQVIIKNADSGPVNCYYHIWAPRIGDLVVEYEGKSAADYPENQDEHSICGYHYDRRES